nr:MAG: amidohydrolase [Bacteroidota bacterium]
MMRLFYAPRIFPGNRPPMRDGAVLIGPGGQVVAVGPYRSLRRQFPEAPVAGFSGALAPGFVNAHVHLELSHLRGRIRPGAGLAGFIGAVRLLRQEADDSRRRAAIEEAIAALRAEGVVAVGDIGNTTEAWEVARRRDLRGYFFLERFGWSPEQAEAIWQEAQDRLRREAFEEEADRRYGITVHALYSTSAPLIERVLRTNARRGRPTSIHMLESEAERELFQHGRGPLAELLGELGLMRPGWRPPGESPLRWLLRRLRRGQRLLLVHMTVASEEEMDLLASFPKAVVVLCPKSNRYIEGRLPPLSGLLRRQLPVAVGTDSLASNDRLSIWEELLELGRAFPELTLERAIQMATWHGARALGMERRLGALAPGRRPGLLWLEGELDNWTYPEAVRVHALREEQGL